jgi:surface protein
MIYKNGYLVKALYKGASPVKNVFKGSNLVFGDNGGDTPTIECDNVLSVSIDGSHQLKINNTSYVMNTSESVNNGDGSYTYTRTLDDLGIETFTSAVEMFYDNSEYNKPQVTEIYSIPCTNNVINMTSMFRGCHNLLTVDLTSFNTSNVTTMTQMFWGCNAINNLNFSTFDTSKVKSMSYMFRNCYLISNLDLSYFNTSSLTSISYMFDYCMNLEILNVNGWDISKITSNLKTFNGCSKLRTLILGNVTQEQYDFWYQRLVDASIQNNVTIEYTLI